MSIPVSLERLKDETQRVGTMPYLLTVSDDERPHCTAIAVQWDGDELCMAPGNRTMTNVASRPAVTLLWPPAEPGGYSLIVDAMVTKTGGTGAGDNTLRAQPTNAVLHRPAQGDATTGDCTSDCKPIFGR